MSIGLVGGGGLVEGLSIESTADLAEGMSGVGDVTLADVLRGSVVVLTIVDVAGDIDLEEDVFGMGAVVDDVLAAVPLTAYAYVSSHSSQDDVTDLRMRSCSFSSNSYLSFE